jgi:hypothetical protein
VKVADLRVNGAGVTLKDKARGEIVRVGNVALAGGEIDLEQRTAAVSTIALRQCRVAVARDKDWRLNVLGLIRSADASLAAAPGAAARAALVEKGWVVDIKQANLERCAVQFDDLAAAQGAAARIVIDPIDARVDNWSTRQDNRARIDLR